MKKSRFPILLALTVMFLFPMAAQGDMYYEQTTYEEFLAGVGGQRLSKETHQKVYVKGVSMRIDQLESNVSLLIRLDKRIIWEIDNKKKSYTETPFNEVAIQKGIEDIRGQQLAPQMEAGMKTAQQGMIEATEAMPEERRDFMRKMMIQQMRKMQTVQSSGVKVGGGISTTIGVKEKVINGFKCKRYKILQNDVPVVDMWVAYEVDPGPDYTDFFEAINVYKTDIGNEIKKIKGLPLKIRYVENFDVLRKVQYIKKITKLKIEDLPKDKFKLPKNFKKIASAKEEEF